MAQSPCSSLATQSFHIAFGIDARYFRSAGVTITSLLENNLNEQFVFHLFVDAMPEQSDHDRFMQLQNKYDTTILFYVIDISFSSSYHFSSLSHYSPIIFARFLMPLKLQGIAKKVLYLDADILCIGSIADLHRIDLGNTIAAVVSEGKEADKRACDLNLQNNRYFNSGVMYIDIEKWVAVDVTSSLIKTVQESNGQLLYPDQDALNIVLDKQVRFIEKRWNFTYILEKMMNAGQYNVWLPDEVIFMHFIGRVKPWYNWNLHISKALFLKYQTCSPWSGIPLDNPINYKQAHIYARSLLRQKRIMAACFWYFRYFLKKLAMLKFG